MECGVRKTWRMENTKYGLENAEYGKCVSMINFPPISESGKHTARHYKNSVDLSIENLAAPFICNYLPFHLLLYYILSLGHTNWLHLQSSRLPAYNLFCKFVPAIMDVFRKITSTDKGMY